MKITPKHIELDLSIGHDTRAHAKRISPTQWQLRKGGEHRRDTINEELLQSYIDSNTFNVLEERVQEETIVLHLDASQVVEELGSLLTVVDTLAQSLANLKAMGVDLGNSEGDMYAVCILTDEDKARFESLQRNDGGRLSAGYQMPDGKVHMTHMQTFDGVDLETIQRALKVKVGKYTYSRKSINVSDFQQSDSPFYRTAEELFELCKGQSVKLELCSARERYDHLSKQYAAVLEDVSANLVSLDASEKHVAAEKERYNASVIKRDKLYAELNQLYSLL